MGEKTAEERAKTKRKSKRKELDESFEYCMFIWKETRCVYRTVRVKTSSKNKRPIGFGTIKTFFSIAENSYHIFIRNLSFQRWCLVFGFTSSLCPSLPRCLLPLHRFVVCSSLRSYFFFLRLSLSCSLRTHHSLHMSVMDARSASTGTHAGSHV